MSTKRKAIAVEAHTSAEGTELPMSPAVLSKKAAAKSAAAAGGGDAALKALIRGERDQSMLHEVTRYLWWASHEGSVSALDRSFESQKSALLYVCKQNSDSLLRYAREIGKDWTALFSQDPGHAHAITPNQAFDLDKFAVMECDALADYAERVGSAFSRHKVKEGVTFRYAPRESTGCEIDELLALLQREPSANGKVEDHLARQALLLSDIAGFD